MPLPITENTSQVVFFTQTILKTKLTKFSDYKKEKVQSNEISNSVFYEHLMKINYLAKPFL